MGYVYHGNFPLYYEVARTEWLRSVGLSYKQLEEEGYFLPVRSLAIRYFEPARYDDLLTIKVIIKEMPAVRIHFFYEIYNEQEILLNTGETTLVFVDALTRRPKKAPESLLSEIGKHLP